MPRSLVAQGPESATLRSVLVTGAGGMLGRAFRDAVQESPLPIRLLSRTRAELDVTDRRAVMAMAGERIDLIVHCAGLTNADECERDPAAAHRSHVEGTANIVELATVTNAQVFYPQSVFIFDGTQLPVTEQTLPAPTFEYGRVKLEAERHLLAALPGSLVVRMAGFFGGDQQDKNFVGQFTRSIADLLRTGQQEIEVGDRVWQPTYTLDLARNSMLLLERHCSGVYHMGALGEATFHEVASACVDSLGLTRRIRVIPVPSAPFDGAEPARRPRRMVTRNDRLDAEGLNRQRSWRAALHEYLQRPYFDRLREGARSA